MLSIFPDREYTDIREYIDIAMIATIVRYRGLYFNRSVILINMCINSTIAGESRFIGK